MKYLSVKTSISKKAIQFTALFLLLAANQSIGAGWQGTDDFSSAIYSSTNWTFLQQVHGQMTIQVTNGHASFLEPASTTDPQQAWMVWNGTPTVADGWMVDILGHNTVPSGNGGSTLYLAVVDMEAWAGGSGPLYGFTVNMGQHHSSSLSSFGTSWLYPGDAGTNRVVVPCTNNTLFGLRLLYTPASQTIAAWYDPTGSGLGWTELDSITVSEMSPGMKATNTFLFAIVPDTFYGPISEGEIWADNFRLASSAPLPVDVTTVALPNGTNGVAYNQTLTASGGQTPYSWSNSSGALPPGLTLATNGVISGTPTTNGPFSFTVKVTDALTSTATQALSLTVGSSPTVAWIQPTNNLVTVPVGSNVTFAVSVTGTGPFSYQWQMNGTNLPNGIITTVAGNGTNSYSGDGGAATKAALNYPRSVAVDVTGNLFIADEGNNRVRQVSPNGIITTVAGNGTAGYTGDGGAATNAELGFYYGAVALDATGSLFIADYYNRRIRKVGTNGIITTVAGNGTYGHSGDGGAATNAEFQGPTSVAIDAKGNLFIADDGSQRIRKVDTNGIITTVAGNTTYGYSGDGGAATNAELANPNEMAVDATGNLFIADYSNYRVRKVDTNGIITTVAGSRFQGGSGDGGAATNATLNDPSWVAVDTIGNLFISDLYSMVIREVGTDGIITRVAGLGFGTYSGDGGAATNAGLHYPIGLAVDATGNLLIADEVNYRIRKVVFSGPTLALSAVGFGNAGAYDVVVSSPYGSVTSSVVTLKVTLPPLLAPRVIGKTNFACLCSGPAGSNYVLQASTNLVNWNPVSTSTIPVGGSITLTNAISGYNRRFYRVYLQ